MKKISLFVLTALAVAALILALSPLSAGAKGDVFPTGTYTTTITDDDVVKYRLPPFYHEVHFLRAKRTQGEGSGRATILTMRHGPNPHFTVLRHEAGLHDKHRHEILESRADIHIRFSLGVLSVVVLASA